MKTMFTTIFAAIEMVFQAIYSGAASIANICKIAEEETGVALDESRANRVAAAAKLVR